MTTAIEPSISPLMDKQLKALLAAAVTEIPVEEVEAAAEQPAETPTRQLVIINWSGEFDKVLPTLILLSETGDIIYHHEGRPDASEIRVLEGIIQRRMR